MLVMPGTGRGSQCIAVYLLLTEKNLEFSQLLYCPFNCIFPNLLYFRPVFYFSLLMESFSIKELRYIFYSLCLFCHFGVYIRS